ncbi:hypothetical protein BJY17_003183 [Agromyces hippuratus]|uniref:Right handed beta helix domain-containing protein n=1 Tax=Agromyces hippuratus TaxID=286438 RepID=A0A852WWF5_9MICO|nr:right-handed parallel beta-helix repeat-containing protein [Agromyces hippuratus]NYG22436.1 hypothetical protein [Agromyces hippuratus]
MIPASPALRRTAPLAIAAALVASVISPISAPPAAYAAADSALEIFVSPEGSNGGAGSEASPYRTLEKARAVIRSMKASQGLPDGGVTVTLREGDYERDTSFELAKQDSGEEGAPIVYRAYPGEDVRLHGGRVLDGDDFTPAGTDGVGARLSDSVRSSVMQIDLGAAGVGDLGGILQTGYGLPPGDEPAEIFFDGAPMTVARFPNAGSFVKTGTVSDPGGNPRQVLGGNATSRPLDPVYDDGATFRYADERPETWASTEGAWMYGYWYWDWADGNLPIDSIDAATNQVSTKNASHYTVRSNQRYYYYNVPEELDAPGEYYLDRGANVLYFLPPAPLAGTTVDLSLLTEPIVQIDGASHVTFSGIGFENSRGDGIRIASGDHNRVVDSTLANLGGWGARIEGGVDNIVHRSEITRTGHGGVFVGGGDRPTLTRADNAATENTIHDFSRLALTYNPGVMLSGVGNTAADNHIFDAPHQAIAFEGNDHMIEYNDVHDVVQDTADSGAIYTVRDWSWTGTVIRYNYIHDVGGATAPGHDQEGIYLDDLTSGITVVGNVLENVPLAFLIGGGRSNTIENNLVINSSRGLSLDDRGTNWAAGHCAPNGGMQKSLEKMPYQQELWAGRYPWLVGLLTDQPCIPKYNSVQRNVFKDSAAPSIAGSAAANGTIADNWVTTDDLRFVDETGGDLTLSPDSPVFAKVPGFEPLPFERMRKSTREPLEPLDLGLTGWSGAGHPSTEQVHGGTSSHAVVADREILTHTGELRQEGTVTVWFWDDASDTSMQVAANASTGDTGSLFRALGVATTTSTSHYVSRIGTSFVATSVPRSTGWHRFEWVYGDGDALELRIDGTSVATDASSPAFDRIQLGDWWADGRSGSVYFDDVSID